MLYCRHHQLLNHRVMSMAASAARHGGKDSTGTEMKRKALGVFQAPRLPTWGNGASPASFLPLGSATKNIVDPFSTQENQKLYRYYHSTTRVGKFFTLGGGGGGAGLVEARQSKAV